MKKIFFSLFLVVALLALIYLGCQSGNNHDNQKVVIPVTLGKVEKKEISIPIRTSGRLNPKTQIKLSFKTGGIIEKIYVDRGSSVKKGQLLASLNLAEIQARFNNARNGYLKAERDVKRAKNLYRDRAATLEQYQNARTAFDVAQSNLKIARFNLERSVIKAPYRGKILRRLVEVNEMIGAGHLVFVFGSTENRWVVKAGVSGRDVVMININDKAQIKFDAYPDKIFSATVSEISEAVDPVSGTIEVELEINDAGLKLVAGFIARVDIIPTKKNLYTLIPIDALVEGEGNIAFVFTAEGDKAKKIKIRIAHLFKDRVAVDAGLESIEHVVTDGAAYLNDGITIKIID
ncbi:MAG: efflux RND transporter periplasmic adaptor subunit [Candidatus Aminicenantes bacterium]|nr:efflux RND transporter periplasmic adaptor subunit [Candidatus Aminicenantes bacterium]